MIDPPLPGHMNMARDEALFSVYPSQKIPTLRIYLWDSPCVSLGYFQRAEDVLYLENMSSLGITFVRRMTGGAAILHNNEVTYSLSLSCDDLDLTESVKDSFKKLTSFLLVFYKKLGLSADYALDLPGHESGGYGTFCFSCNEDFDIIVEGKKLGGNAQKRKKKIIFQHGSIPLDIDFDLLKRVVREVPEDIADKTHGLSALVGHKFTVRDLTGFLVNSFIETFGVEHTQVPFSAEEGAWIEKLLKTKYSLDSWNRSHE